MAEPTSTAVKRRMPSWVFPAFGYAVAIASLVWVFHGVDLKQVAQDFSKIAWQWIVLAVVADVSVYFVQGWRWSVLLSPLKPVPWLRSVRAVYVGIFANEVLPLRSGELIRCYLQSRWNNISFPVVLSSYVIERVFDGIWLSLAFFATLMFLDMPGLLVQMGRILAVVVFFLVLVLLYFKYHRHHASNTIAKRKWLAWLQHLLDGLHDMGDSRSFWYACLLSFPYLFLQIIPFWALMENYDMGLGFWAASVVLIIVRIGTVIPQAPGNVGTFQFFTVLALGLFGVDKTTAAGLSLLMFGVITLQLLVVGFIALAMTGLRIDELRRHANSAQAASKAGRATITPPPERA
jgi:glycosyltransferase 2 family protein